MPATKTAYIDRQLSAPARDGQAVVIGTPFTKPSRSLYIGTGGDVNVVMESGATLLHRNVPSGTILPVYATSVSSSSTTASNILAYY